MWSQGSCHHLSSSFLDSMPTHLLCAVCTMRQSCRSRKLHPLKQNSLCILPSCSLLILLPVWPPVALLPNLESCITVRHLACTSHREPCSILQKCLQVLMLGPSQLFSHHFNRCRAQSLNSSSNSYQKCLSNHNLSPCHS